MIFIIKKIIKKSLFSLGVVLPLTTSAVIITSCGYNNNNDKNDNHDNKEWQTFLDDAQKANANEIVDNSNVSNWKKLNPKKNELFLGNFKINNNKSISVSIQYSKIDYNQVIGTFSIDYQENVAYDVSNWNSVNAPKPTKVINPYQYWTDFKKEAQKATATDILTGSGGVKEWESDLYSKLVLANFDVNDTKETISVVATNYLSHSTVSFTITFHKIKYNINQWKYNNDLNCQIIMNDSMPIYSSISKIIKIDNTIYIGDIQGIWTSINDGKTFILNAQMKNHDSSFSGYNINKIIKIDNTIYVLARQNGLWTSTDDGKTFSKNSSIPTNSSIIQVIKINNKIYVISHDEIGMYYSIDNGKTFIGENIYIEFWSCKIVKIDNTIYLGTDEGLFSSVDDGKTFIKNKSIMINDYYNIAIDNIEKIDNNIYVLTNRGIFRSVDNGKNFIKSNAMEKEFTYKSRLIKIDNTIYYQDQYQDQYNECGLWNSTDDGKTFSQNSSIPDDVVVNKITKIDNEIYCATNKGLYISNNDGKTFSQSSSFPSDTYIYEVTKINHTIYIGEIYIYDESNKSGGLWQQHSFL